MVWCRGTQRFHPHTHCFVAYLLTVTGLVRWSVHFGYRYSACDALGRCGAVQLIGFCCLITGTFTYYTVVKFPCFHYDDSTVLPSKK